MVYPYIHKVFQKNLKVKVIFEGQSDTAHQVIISNGRRCMIKIKLLGFSKFVYHCFLESVSLFTISNLLYLLLIHDVNPSHVTARRDPVVHFADLMKMQEALLVARRGPVVCSAMRYRVAPRIQ